MELALAGAAGHHFRALGDGVGDVLLGALERGRRGQRPHVGALVQRVAHPQLRDPLDQCRHECVLDRGVHQDPLGRGAALAGQVEAAGDGGIGGPVDVGVGQHDLGAVAAQLQHAVLEAGVARNLLALWQRSP